MISLIETLDEAVARFGQETERLRYLPENRYNREIFPTSGQYDWFSGQALYCLIRHLRPERIIEVSTSSGYSSLFSASALKANQKGRLETFEYTPSSAAAAQANFERYGVKEVVRLWVGDARETAAALVNERQQQRPGFEILFLDSEHTEEFARSYLDLFLPDAHPDSLFHMHDILPPDAQVKFRPLAGMKKWSFRPKGWLYRRLHKIAPRWVPHHIRLWVPPAPYTEITSEADFGNQLAARIPAGQQLYMHKIIDRYPAFEGHRYDHLSIARCGPHGEPREWNESWWTICGPLKEAYQLSSQSA
jgi:predicted O-methyltransferase YrrM